MKNQKIKPKDMFFEYLLKKQNDELILFNEILECFKKYKEKEKKEIELLREKISNYIP